MPAGEAGRPGRVLSSLFNLFFPAPCRICGELLGEISRVPVCRACWAALQPLSPSGQCAVCGLPCSGDLASAAGFRCGECLKSPPCFDLARSYGAYGGALRELVHLMKYQGMTPLAGPLAQRMARIAEAPEWAEVFSRCQAVVPMPLDPARRRERGYNQAELLAREVARHRKIPLLLDACRRVRATAPQAGLSRSERRANVQGAFAAEKKFVEDRVLLLVDDVMTTGATLNACSRALLQAGAAGVVALTAARTIEWE